MSTIRSTGKKDTVNIAKNFKKSKKNSHQVSHQNIAPHSPTAHRAQQALLDEEKNNMRNG